MEKLTKQPCPFCSKKTLALVEDQKDIPYFGKVYLFSMNCSSCKYNKADVESAEQKPAAKYTMDIESAKDMGVRIVKSSTATVKMPQLRLSVTPGPASIGYISNIEGVITRFEDVIKQEKEDSEDLEAKKKCKNLLKKLWKIKLGDVKTKIAIEDPYGNSAIVSNKAKVEKLQVKK